MYDDLFCAYPLPNPAHNALWFQTKSLDRDLSTYRITREGTLQREEYNLDLAVDLLHGVELPPQNPASLVEGEIIPFHGAIIFYTSGSSDTWVEYLATFTDGKLESIVPHQRDSIAQEPI